MTSTHDLVTRSLVAAGILLVVPLVSCAPSPAEADGDPDAEVEITSFENPRFERPDLSGQVRSTDAKAADWTPQRLVTGSSLEGIVLAGAGNAASIVSTQPVGPQPAGAPAPPPQPTGPLGQIIWDEGGDSVDFGALVQGDKREHVFEVSNGGEGDLVISDIRSTCGCTVATTLVLNDDGEWVPYVNGSPIAPGEGLKVPTTLDSKNKHGRMNTAVNIFSNDARSVVSLRLSAEVTPVLAVEPLHVNLQQMMSTDVKETTITVSSSVLDAFSLTVQEDILPEELAVEVVPVEPNAEGRSNKWEVRATLGPNVPEGNKNYPIRLITDIVKGEVAEPHPEGEEVDEHGHDHGATTLHHEAVAYLIAQVKGMITANPYYVSFALVRPGQVISRTVRVECHDEGFEFAAPTTAIRGYDGDFEYPDALTVAVRAVPDVAAYDIEVKLEGLPEDLNGSFRGIVDVIVGHPSKEKLEIPFSGVCRGGVVAPQPVLPPGPQLVPVDGGANADADADADADQ